MARQSFTRESALQYLAGRTDLAWKKPLTEYKTPYLKRLASEYKRAEQAGKETPKLKEVRGHGKPRIQYKPGTTQFADSYEVGNKRYPVRFDELSPLLSQVGESSFYNVLIFGVPKNYGGFWADPKKPDWRTYRTDRRSLLNSIELAKGNVKDFAEFVSGVEWTKGYAIAIRQGPVNPYGKTARKG
jgi:hypothetical protein